MDRRSGIHRFAGGYRAGARAQFGFGATPGYPSVSQYGGGYGGGYGTGIGSYGAGYGGYGGYGGGYGGGSVTYSPGSGYGPVVVGDPYASGGLGYNPAFQVGNGQLGNGIGGPGSFFDATTPTISPQTTVALDPLYNAITAVPGWNHSSSARATHARHRARPVAPRSQFLSDDGTILWPEGTPNDESLATARKEVDSAVKGLVKQEKMYGQASTRSVVDAKNKLHAFAKPALLKVKAHDAATTGVLETFMVELGKTLETLAVKY